MKKAALLFLASGLLLLNINPILAQLTGSSLPLSSAKILLNPGSATITTPPMIAAGQYNNGINIYPLLANSRDGGANWAYRVHSTVPVLPFGFDNGHFTATSCSGLRCVAVGLYDFSGSYFGYPLFAYSSDGGLLWNYADNNAALLPIDFINAQFTSLSCSGLHCVAAGSYANGTYSSPFLAHSADGGVTWAYPISSVPIVPNFPFGFNGEFSSLSCSGLICVAGGFYNHLPFLGHSHDGGATWAFLSGLQIANLPTDLVLGAFNAVSCSGLICVAAGNYDIADQNNNGNIGYPLLARSIDGGATWSYVINRAVPFLSFDFNQGKFLGASCSGLICVVGGFFNDFNADSHPLLALSQNGGTTWAYTIDTDIATLPSDFINGQFASVSCSGLNCVAAGNYQNSSNTFPLLANSSNGGTTWVYAIDRTTPVLADDFNNGQFISASCSGLYCICAGSYDNGAALYPLLAHSSNGGVTWAYAIESTTPLQPSDFMSGGFTSADVSLGLLFGSF